MNIVKALKNYFKTYPNLEKETIFVDFLKEDDCSFAIVPKPTRPITVKNIDGSYEKQYEFKLVGRFAYSKEVHMNIENSSFFQNLEEWLIENNENDILPDLGEGYQALELSVTSNGYLIGISPDGRTGQYEISFSLLYEKEK